MQILFTNYLKICFAQLLTKISDALLITCVIWHFIQHYDAKIFVSFMTLISLPYLAMIFLAGYVINKIGNLRVVIFADILKGGLFIGSYLIWKDFNYNSLLLIFLLANCIDSFFTPAILSLPKYICKSEMIQRTIASLYLCMTLSTVIGPILAILYYNKFSFQYLLLITGIVYVVAALVESTIQSFEIKCMIESPKIPNPLILLFEYKNIGILLLILFFMGLVLAPIQIFIPLYVKGFYGNKIIYLTVLQSLFSAGTLTGGLLLSFVRFNKFKIVMPYICAALCYLLFSIFHYFWMSCLCLFLFGLFSSLGGIATISYLQKIPNNEHIPYIMSFVSLLPLISGPIALLLVGYMMPYITLTLQIFFYALFDLFLTFALWKLFSKNMKSSYVPDSRKAINDL